VLPLKLLLPQLLRRGQLPLLLPLLLLLLLLVGCALNKV
jgi:hypothetical protein